MSNHTSLTIHAASVVTPALNTQSPLIDILNSNSTTVSNHILIEYSVFSERKQMERKKRYAHAASLLKEWASENPQYDEKIGSKLEEELSSSKINLKTEKQ